MGTFATPTTIDYVASTGQPSGRAWCNTSIGYMAFSGVVSAGGLAQPIKLDFSPPGASVGIAFNTVLSVGGELFTCSVGQSLLANYTAQDLHTQGVGKPTGSFYISETWTRVS